MKNQSIDAKPMRKSQSKSELRPLRVNDWLLKQVPYTRVIDL